MLFNLLWLNYNSASSIVTRNICSLHANDCPADVFSFFVGVQQQVSANCLNDINMVQDSDGASIASTPFNSAPSQALALELEFGDNNGDTTPPLPPPPETGILNVFKIVECTDSAIANIPDMCEPSCSCYGLILTVILNCIVAWIYQRYIVGHDESWDW